MRNLRRVQAFLVALLVSIMLSAVPVLAATATQDGLEVTLTTDKEEYAKGEQIVVTLAVTNTNTEAVTNVSMESFLPEGYELAEGNEAVKQLEKLEAGETASLVVTYVAKEDGKPSLDDGEAAETGESANVYFWSILFFVAGTGIVVFIWKNKKSMRSMLSVLLVSAMVGTSVNVPQEIFAEEVLVKAIQVGTVTSVGDEMVSIECTVLYDGFADDEEVPTEPDIDIPSDDFEEKEGNATFNSREEEIENICILNDNEFPYSVLDENGVPSYIDGKFSGKKVKSAEDAIDALKDIHYIMKLHNAEQEFVEEYSENVSVGGTTGYYRLQQVYHDIPVYGHQLIISANEEGEIWTLTGHYLPDIDVNTVPNVSVAEAIAIAEEASGSQQDFVSDGLVIYEYDTDEIYLAWVVSSIMHNYIISAETGEIISGSSLTDSFIIGNGTDSRGQNVEFPVVQTNGEYYLQDDVRNIKVGDFNFGTAQIDPIKESANNSNLWSNYPEALETYSNIIKTYDYYANVLGRNGTDNAHKEIQIAVRGCKGGNHADCTNAMCSDDFPITYIFVMHQGGFEKSLDILAHEYTHGVSTNVWAGANIIHSNASGAINEAYSDIIGDLIEEKQIHQLGNFSDYGVCRDASKPKIKDAKTAEKKFCTKKGDHDKHNCDRGGVHDNASMIDHVGYLIDQRWPSGNHADELATLFYKSMFYLSSNCDFLDCRHAVLAAAKSMNMSGAKRTVIAQAFYEVGIYHEDEEAWATSHHIIGEIKDAQTGEPIIDAWIMACGTGGFGLGGGTGYSDARGSFDLKVGRNTYDVTIYADDYRLYKISDVNATSLFNMNCYIGTIYLTPIGTVDSKNVYASGKITNASTGNPIEGASVKFRKGANNKSGEYVQTVAGLDIELITDNDGKYYTAALPAGNYTMEVSKAGFITGYSDIISGNSSICNNQNLSLTPELLTGEIRIVLEWGQTPRDLDSHMTGYLHNGNDFHVYYRAKVQNDVNGKLCELDVDDTTGYGPETITLNTTESSPYFYYIYNYSGDSTLASSNAKVSVYRGGDLIERFYVPTNQGTGRYWNVFAIMDGNLIVQNTITSSADTSYVDYESVLIVPLDDVGDCVLSTEKMLDDPKKEVVFAEGLNSEIDSLIMSEEETDLQEELWESESASEEETPDIESYTEPENIQYE